MSDPVLESRKRMLAMGLNPDEWDEVPMAKEATASTAGPQTPSASSAVGAFARSAGRGLIPSFSAAGLGTIGARIGAPLGPLGMLGGALVGGLGGSLLADKGQTAAVNTFAPDFAKRMEEQSAIDAQEHPVASAAGGIASALPFFEVNPGATIRGLSKLPALIRGAASPVEAQLAKNAAIQLGMGGAQGVVSPLLSGQTPTMSDIGTGLGQALLFGNTRPWMHSLPGMPPLPQAEAPLQPSMNRNPIALLPFETPSTRRERVETAARGTVSPEYGQPHGEPIVPMGEAPPLEVIKRESAEPSPTPFLVNPPEIVLPFREQVRRQQLFTAGTELDGLQRQLVSLPEGPEKIVALKRANDLISELQSLREQANTTQPQGLGAEGSYPPNAEQLGTFQSRAVVPEHSDVTKVPAPEKLPQANQTGQTRTPQKVGVVPPESLKAELPLPSRFKPEEWQVVVQQGEIPGQKTYVQYDRLLKDGKTSAEGFGTLKDNGITGTMPDFSKLPTGRYTFNEAVKLLEKGKTNAPNPIPQPQGDQSKHIGVQQGQNVPANGPQVREGQSKEAGNRGLPVGGAAEPLTEVQALAGGKMPAEKEAELNSWLNQILSKKGDGGIHFQLESEMAGQPLEALLAHPQNRAVFDLMDQLSAKHRIERELNPQPGGKEAHGAALIAERLIHLNPDNIAPDTFAHEISEIVFQDLLHSPNAADRTLAARGLSIFHGDRERLAQALGRRVTELAQLKVEGLTLKRFKEWFRDFVSRMKEVWGKGNEEDFNRLLARRILYGDYTVRNVPADPKTIHYQEVERRLGEETERGATVRNAMTYGTEPSLPKVRSLLDQVARTTKPELAKAFDETFRLDREYWGITNRVLAGVDALDGAHSFTRKEMEAAGDYLFNKLDTRGHPDLTPSDKALAFEQQVWRPALSRIVAETRQYNLMLEDQNGYRFIHETPYYMPEMFRGDVVDAMKRHPNSEESQRYESIIARHIAEKKNISIDDARKEWQERYRDPIIDGGVGSGQTAYGPLELPHGIGVPPELRETNLFRVSERYFNRAGKALAFHRAFRLDPVAGYLAGITDQFGHRFPQPENRPDLSRPYGDIEDVQTAMKIVKGDYDSIDRTLNAIGRVAKSGMMQTLTGTVDLATYHAQIAPWVHPAQIDVFAKGVANIKDGIKHAFDWGVIRKRSLAEAKLAAGTGYQGTSAWVDRWNKLGDLINLVSGRDALERWTRGVTQSTMEALTYSNLGWLSNPEVAGSRKASAFRFMNQFGPKDWARQLEQFRASPEGVPDQWVQQIAANATEHVQGTYDPRDQPKYSLGGHAAPFLSLAKWNIGALNRFTKNVIGPLKQGNPTPLIMSLGMGYLGGQAVSYLRQWMTGHKPAEATWDEVLAAGGNGLAYKLLAISSYSGFGGIATEFAKQGMDLMQGNSVQALRWPALGFAENVAKRIGQAGAAMEAGENSIDTLGSLALQMAKDNIQIARMLNQFSEQGQQTLQRANLARDVRQFRLLNGYPVSPMGSSTDTNPFLNPLAKTYERTEDFNQIAQTAPQLRQQAIDRGGGDPEKIASLLRSYRSMGSDLIPSLKSNPMQFAKLINFVGSTQGDEAAQNILQQYYKKNALDSLKASLIPSFRQ
jgi:hypothetical protein